jgi:hypothetical protein
MNDVLKRLRGYPGDLVAVMSPDFVEEIAVHVEQLEAELAAERERADKCEREENARWLQAIQQRDKLREALEPFARVPLHEEDLDDDVFYVKTRDLRRARVVLKETGGGDE